MYADGDPVLSPDGSHEDLDLSDTINDLDANLQESKRSAVRLGIARRSSHSHGVKDDPNEKVEGKLKKYTPALSVGAYRLNSLVTGSPINHSSHSTGSTMNLRDFFDGLKGNVHILESQGVTPEEFRALSSSLAAAAPVQSFRSVSQYVAEDAHIRPTANAAYLHAIRMYRPSNRVRSLVDHHPENYRGVNKYNPSYLWVGLG